MYLIKKVSEISGVSVRTLHHYDEIGLLSPVKKENGYRYYSDEDMSTLQMILYYKYLGFSLRQIKDLLEKEDVEIISHLKNQLLLLKNEKERLLTLIDTLEKTIESNERRTIMTTREKFKGFIYENNPILKESAIDMYGKEVVEEAIEKHKGKEHEFMEGFNKIFSAFSENIAKGLKATSSENVKLAEELHEHICKYNFNCSKEVFSSIGHGYVENQEFKENLDKFGDGTAQYVCDVIQQYTNEK